MAVKSFFVSLCNTGNRLRAFRSSGWAHAGRFLHVLVFCCVMLLVGFCNNSYADTNVKIFDLDESVSPATRQWKFTVPPFGVEHQVRLSLDARIDWPGYDGSNPWIKVLVNGKAVTAANLLNKLDEFKMRSGLEVTWFRKEAWRVVMAPDFEAGLKETNNKNFTPGVDPYRYVWDISDYVKPGENELRIENLLVIKTTPTKLVLRNAAIEVGRFQPSAEAAAITPAPTGPLPVYLAGKPKKIAMQVQAAAGALRVDVASKSFDIATRTSLPAGAWTKAEALPAGENNAAGGLSNGQKKSLSWETPTYRVNREIEVRDDHVHIADTLTNTTNELIGVKVENRLVHPSKPEKILVAGRETTSTTVETNNAYQPSVFAQWPGMGVGMLAEDDIFRVHIRTFCDSTGMGLADDQLGIEPGKPVTLEWSIYPVVKDGASNDSAGDYWDLVNTVRRNWDTNFAIPGPATHVGGKMTAEPTFPEWLRKYAIKIAISGIGRFPDEKQPDGTTAVGKLAHGTGVLSAPNFIASEAAWARRVHEQAPEIKVLSYFHAQISTEPDGEKKYAADRLIGDDGKPMSYPYRYSLPQYLPTRDNAYGKALWGFVHAMLDDVKADGLYWDEMSHSVIESTSHGPWDGHTVTIDPKTHAITGKRTSIPLVMQPLKLDIVHYLRDHNKLLIANTPPMTRTMLREKIVRFVETGIYSRLINTHFASPVGLANNHKATTMAEDTIDVRRILRYGGVYYGWSLLHPPVAWDFTKVMYPITPARLGPGFVIGEERIHTAISGRFGFLDGSAAEVYIVNPNGERVTDQPVQETVENGIRLYDIRIPSDYFAILVKK